MDRARISDIAERWMIPTSKTAYMAGLEKKPVIAAASGVRVIDTEGKEYLDFGSGQMAAALGHNHPRYVAAVERNLKTISHSTKTFLNVDRLELHERLGQILTPPLQKSLFLVSGSDANATGAHHRLGRVADGARQDRQDVGPPARRR